MHFITISSNTFDLNEYANLPHSAHIPAHPHTYIHPHKLHLLLLTCTAMQPTRRYSTSQL